jgi:hypothetical protein
MRELAERFGMSKPAERKALAAVLHRLADRRAPPEEVAALAFAEGAHRRLSRAEVIEVVNWVAHCRRGAA